MTDKSKTDKTLDKTKAGIAASLESCGLNTDSSSANISAKIIADNLAGGAKTHAEILGGIRGGNDKVWKCVADIYDDKPDTIRDKITAGAGSLVDWFKNAASDTKEKVEAAKPEPFKGPTSADKYNKTVPANERI